MKEVLADTEKLQEELYKELRGRIQEADQTVPLRCAPACCCRSAAALSQSISAALICRSLLLLGSTCAVHLKLQAVGLKSCCSGIAQHKHLDTDATSLVCTQGGGLLLLHSDH